MINKRLRIMERLDKNFYYKLLLDPAIKVAMSDAQKLGETRSIRIQQLKKIHTKLIEDEETVKNNKEQEEQIRKSKRLADKPRKTYNNY